MTEPDTPFHQSLQRHWTTVYTSRASTEASWYQSAPDLSLSLIRASAIPHAAPIIDIGGGASTLPDHLLAAGYKAITVLDIADAAIEQSKQRLGQKAGNIDWRVADITTWRPTSQYALWHDRAVFHFLTRPDDRRAYLSTLRIALQPAGTVILATFALDGPEHCSGLPVRRYNADTLAAELGPAFTLLQTATQDHTTPSGSIQAFIYCRFMRTNAA